VPLDEEPPETATAAVPAAASPPPVEALFQIAHRLGSAVSASAVAQVVVDEVLAALGANRGVVYGLEDGATELTLLGHAGLDPESAHQLQALPLDAPAPLTAACRSRTPLWLGTHEALRAAFPQPLTRTPDAELQAIAALPLIARQEMVGGIGLSFATPRTFPPSERAFFQAVADLCAQAMERARLFNGERAARREAEAALRRAQESDRRKDEFLAILGHELRNPLSPIVTALELLRMKQVSAPELKVIERQVTHLQTLVNDLLDVSRVTRGKVQLRRQRVELSAVVARACEMAAPLLEERRQRLSFDLPATGLAVDGDPERLAQVVTNLLTNAAKYSEPGSAVAVIGTRGDDHAILRVVDQGIGVEPDVLSRIFEPFVQQPKALDRAGGGLGLGLTIVKNLVELHGGRVAAESAGLGLGASFTVELPLAAAGAAVAAPVPPAAGRPAGPDRRRVLIVDDNVDAATLTAELLEPLGYEVAVAHDGPAALKLAEAFDPHMCLLDVGLPVMDGYELARRLRGRGAQDLRLIAVTGYGQDHDRARALEAGFDRHLVKPVDVGELTRALAG
jgi:signal transduction histidine kinase/CheY-like chemotaxis protein